MYGLFNTTVLIGIQLIGFDFYVFNTREILNGERKQSFLLNQFYFHLIVYAAVFLGYFGGYQIFKFPKVEHLNFLIIVTTLEHLSTEMYRLLLTLKKTLLASLILFMRTSSWILVLIVCWELKLISLNLEILYVFWIAGNIVSLIIPFFFLSRHLDWRWEDFAVKRNWMLKGLIISLPFFICTIVLKLLEYSNRYIISYYHGKSELGVYTFYANFAGTLSVGVFTLVTMVQFPNVVELGGRGVNGEFMRATSKFAKDTFFYSFLILPLVVLAVAAIIWYLERNEYWDDFPSFLILLGANIFISLNYVTHYILYSLKQDFIILYSNLFGMLICILINFWLVPTFAQLGASTGIAFGFLAVLIYQFWMIRKLLKNTK